MDLDLYRLLNGYAAGHDGPEDALHFLALNAQFLFAALLAVAFLARGKWASRSARRGVTAAGLSALMGLALAHLIASLWDRPRPYEAHPGDVHLFIPASHDPSFPSDHATAAFAIAVALALRSRAVGVVALGMAAGLALARVMVGVHYPTDVLGGALLGTLAALLLWIPSVRRPLHELADRAGKVYDWCAERVAARMLQSGRG